MSETTTVRTMTTKDATLQSDITKLRTETDGSFKRADASFRNFIQKGGYFEPQLGMVFSQYLSCDINFYDFRSLSSLCVLCLP